MGEIHRIEHTKIHVSDLNRAVEFYTDAMGLIEIARKSGTIYLGCGLNGNFQLAVAEGDTGIEHFAVRATDAEAVDEYEDRLREEDVATERVDADEPGQVAGVRFKLPTDVPMEIVAVEDQEYEHAEISAADRAGHAPSTIDHVQWFTPSVRDDMEFLRDVVGMPISDTAGPEDDLEMAFARCNALHHDVALKAMPEDGPDHASLHHVAWGFDSLEHMKVFLDTVCHRGMEFERGIGRHYAGNNLYSYFWEPGGNRFELCAEMAVVKTPEPNHSPNYETATTAWGPGAPDSFSEGSGLVNHD
jgi:catechol 2,3-dioxygenase